MKIFLIVVCLVLANHILFAQDSRTIVLNPPDLKKGLPAMKALSLRASANDFGGKQLGLQDLSDLLWAANGINRKNSGKRTAPSAMNAKDVSVYVFMDYGVYLYNADQHALAEVTNGDFRKLIGQNQKNVSDAPVLLLLVSDISRFPFGNDSQKRTWGALDAGTVSQNISIFCASTGLITRPRAFMDEEKIRILLGLKGSQLLMLNHPVAYGK